jgi:hypothetical protein
MQASNVVIFAMSSNGLDLAIVPRPTIDGTSGPETALRSERG